MLLRNRQEFLAPVQFGLGGVLGGVPAPPDGVAALTVGMGREFELVVPGPVRGRPSATLPLQLRALLTQQLAALTAPAGLERRTGSHEGLTVLPVKATPAPAIPAGQG